MFPAEMTVGSLIVTTQRHLTLTRVPPPPPPGPVLSASHQRQSREPVIGGISVLQLARGDWLDVSEEAIAHFLLEFTCSLRIFHYPWWPGCWARINRTHEVHSPGCSLEVNASRGSFCLTRLKAASSARPPPSSRARLCRRKACRLLTSCLSVSLAIISLWSMRDSSSTSSSDWADSGASGDFGSLEGEVVFAVGVTQAPGSMAWRLRPCSPLHGTTCQSQAPEQVSTLVTAPA